MGENQYAAHLFFNCKQRFLFEKFLTVTTPSDKNNRPKLVINKAVRKYIEVTFLLHPKNK